ncbi:MAG: hypothetical protein JRF72_05555 [Deltaproteobacteria bacterium]|jgi:hypothetical protein|nr:hypothetical protein [Deltaproteobacteria bacterium]
MSKWINKSLEPIESPDVESDDHIEIEDLARLVEGHVSQAENERFTRHLNRCPRCYEILQDTLSDLSRESSAQPASVPAPVPALAALWKRKTFYALAASVILVFLVGGQLIFKYVFQQPQIISAAVDLDQDLKDILMEDESLQWEKGPRLDRLVAALQKKGHVFKDLNLVVLARPYYQKKSLFGPQEILHIRVEGRVAYLEVKPKE